MCAAEKKDCGLHFISHQMNGCTLGLQSLRKWLQCLRTAVEDCCGSLLAVVCLPHSLIELLPILPCVPCRHPGCSTWREAIIKQALSCRDRMRRC